MDNKYYKYNKYKNYNKYHINRNHNKINKVNDNIIVNSTINKDTIVNNTINQGMIANNTINEDIIVNNKTNKKSYIIFIILIIIFLVFIGLVFISNNKNNKDNKDILDNKEKEVKINYLDYYYPIVSTLNDKIIYKLENNEFIEYGNVSSNVILSLNKDEYFEKGYFKIIDTEYYIDYKDLKEAREDEKENLIWKNYIPFNESINTKNNTNLYKNDKLIFTFNESLTLPIIIKDDNYYGIIYKDKLYYVLKDECEVIQSHNTDLKHTYGFSALVYHATYDHENYKEKERCLNANSVICLSDIEFDKQMKYLKDNNYYTATMKDVEMFIDGKVQLPEHTVVVTIDDGYYLDAAVKVLEKYELHATLFLIGALADLDEWKTDSFYSKSIELHSHTYMMHTPNICLGGQGSILKCGNKEEILADLKKSREQLNGSTVFCYPFFEYNDYAINILKEAGFTMAFAGGRQKIRVGSNKMKLPRYGIINTTSLNNFISIIS